MCVLCAAIPMTVALGARAVALQQRQRASGLPAWWLAIPAGRTCALAISVLGAASVVAHTRYGQG